MMGRAARQGFMIVVVALSMLASGCGRPLGGTPTPSRFYVLTPVASEPPSASSATGRPHPTIGVTLAGLPDSLNREEIVTRTSQTRVEFADFDRWAGQLDDNISNVLALNLSSMVPSDRVIVLPSSRSVSITYRIHVDIATFELAPSGSVELIAVWQIFRGDGVRLLTMQRAQIATPVAGTDYDAIVGSMSQALGELSGQIANAIQGY